MGEQILEYILNEGWFLGRVGLYGGESLSCGSILGVFFLTSRVKAIFWLDVVCEMNLAQKINCTFAIQSSAQTSMHT